MELGKFLILRSPRSGRLEGRTSPIQRLQTGRNGIMRWIAVFVAALLGVAIQAEAQNPPAAPPNPVRGTIEKLDGQNLSVKTREGPVATIALADNFTVSGVAKRSLTDIKAGDYVASTSVKGADDKLHAVEIHIFPEAMW